MCVGGGGVVTLPMSIAERLRVIPLVLSRKRFVFFLPYGPCYGTWGTETNSNIKLRKNQICGVKFLKATKPLF